MCDPLTLPRIARQHEVTDPAKPTEEEIAKITRVDLRGADISDLEPIKGLTSLEDLSLEGTQVSEEQMAGLQRALPKLIIQR